MKGQMCEDQGKDELRRQAEKRLRESPGSPVAPDTETAFAAQRLVHELKVHQIELEMQNEELKRARDEVEEGLARYTDLYEFAPVGYLTLDGAGVIQQANLTGTRLLGLERARLIGKSLELLVAAECRPDFAAFLAASREPGARETCEVALVQRGAAPRTVELTGAATDHGQECRIVVTDITERKQAEHDRTELEAQLARAQKLESIGTFAGGIAHDFNNILGGILGGLSLLDLELGEANAHHDDILEMEALVERGAELTRQLLGFARRGKYDVRPLDLARVVRKTSAIFGRTRRDITIQIDVAPGLQAVLMDHSQLEQVLMNLFVNAGQAMGEGGRLILSAENAVRSSEEVAPHGAKPGRFVKLVVADTGIGMDAATQARIFEPFFTTKGPGQGTGLGLASVYGITKSHGGFITVESETGRGTSFTLFLPATDRPTAADNTVVAPIQSGHETILVVDDEAQILKVYTGLLKKLGYDVLTAAGGSEALDLVRHHRDSISLVILDMTMPGMSGCQTYDSLQELEPDLKVLLSSGYSIDGQAHEILARGCNGFIQKPFDIATLSAKLREILPSAHPHG